jgi:CubicO group peptidase (beta-lactamase class C family)
MTALDEAFDRLDTFIAHRMRASNTPGLAMALMDRERLLRVSTYGYADLARGTPVTPETRFAIGSDGKAFTALALLQQLDAGRLDLHAPVTQYLPWFAVRSRYAPITTHHLLCHSAGIIAGSEFAPDARYEVYALRDTDAAYPPGQHYHYSDVGYKALGLVLEHLTHQPYGQVIQSGILDPLGMAVTESVITHATRPHLAVGYQALYDDQPAHRDQPLVPAPWVETNSGDGCLASTVGDMAAYVRLLLNRGQGASGRLISAASFERMTGHHSAMGHGRSYDRQRSAGAT